MSITPSWTVKRLTSGVAVTMTAVNTAATAKTLKVWATCTDNRSPSGLTNPVGAEAVTENWLAARESTGAWVNLGFPAAFAATFATLADAQMLTVLFNAGQTKTLEFLLTIPAGATTSGGFNFGVSGRCMDT